MDSVTSEATKIAVAVPGSLGIILAIATFIFMAWLVQFVLKENAKREERLAGIIERDLVAQKAQLDRLEMANSLQRSEHQAIADGQKNISNGQDTLAKILERITGMLSTLSHPPHQS